MMRIMLVDDERLALELLEIKLRQIAGKRGINFFMSSYLSAQAAISSVDEQQPDIVFMDIHMPEISGIQAAEILQERCPGTKIVFLTAYDDYAVKAFELQAVDYLMKPLQSGRLEKTIDRLIEQHRIRLSDKAKQEEKAVSQIYSFKGIRFSSKGGTPIAGAWRTAKAQELFAYLLHKRGEAVHKSALTELLLPDLEEKRALTQLYTYIYQIRQTLQKVGISVTIRSSSIQESYTLELGEDVVMEMDEWENDLVKAGRGGQATHGRMRDLLEAYRGDYLSDYDYVWAEGERERLRQLWMAYARRWIQHEWSREKHAEALPLLERLQAMDPYQEQECLALLQLYDKLGQFDKTIAHYGQIRSRFNEELGLPVPAAIDDWYKQRMIESRRK
ncbi:response regulator [Paenibacillus sp. HB172176]|uniref:response regulator n=1 Tax=Paenibacillus sp. HB172176 TaxID=2493690 RepID=UPI00143A0862|nr:response regulator [Paenibacillus sp. HB172176]